MPINAQTKRRIANEYPTKVIYTAMPCKPSFIQYWIVDTIFGITTFITHHIFRLFPAKIASNIGGTLGRLTGKYIYPWLDHNCKNNLHYFCPDCDKTQIKQKLELMWDNLGRTMAELPIINKLEHSGKITVTGGNIVTRYQKTDTPIIFLFVHLGNWETIAKAILPRKITLNVVYLIPSNRYLHHIVVQARKRIGYKLVTPDYTGTRNLHRALKSGESVIFAIDETYKGKVAIPIIDNQNRTDGNIYKALRLAKRYNAAIIPIRPLRHTDANFTVEFISSLDELLNHSNASDEEKIHAINELVAPWFHENPEQWYFLHELKIDS